jgi:hypothetical protein
MSVHRRRDVSDFRVEDKWELYDAKTNPPGVSLNAICGGTGAGKSVLMIYLLQRMTRRFTTILCCSVEAYKLWARYFPVAFVFDTLDDTFRARYNELLNVYGGENLKIEHDVNIRFEQAKRELKATLKAEYHAERRRIEQAALDGQLSPSEHQFQLDEFERQFDRTKTQRHAALLEAADRAEADAKDAMTWRIVCDDLMFEPTAMTDPLWIADDKAGRHSLRERWVLTQGLLDVAPKARSQYKRIFLWPELNPQTKKQLFTSWITFDFKPSTFDRVLAYFRHNEWWMMIDLRPGRRKKTAAIEADDPPPPLSESNLRERISYIDPPKLSRDIKHYCCPELQLWYSIVMTDFEKVRKYLQEKMGMHLIHEEQQQKNESVGQVKRLSEAEKRERLSQLSRQAWESTFAGTASGPLKKIRRALQDHDAIVKRWYSSEHSATYASDTTVVDRVRSDMGSSSSPRRSSGSPRSPPPPSSTSHHHHHHASTRSKH